MYFFNRFEPTKNWKKNISVCPSLSCDRELKEKFFINNENSLNVRLKFADLIRNNNCRWYDSHEKIVSEVTLDFRRGFDLTRAVKSRIVDTAHELLRVPPVRRDATYVICTAASDKRPATRHACLVTCVSPLCPTCKLLYSSFMVLIVAGAYAYDHFAFTAARSKRKTGFF